GVSLAHFCNLIRATWVVDFIANNVLRARLLFNEWGAVGAVLGMGAGVGVLLARPRGEGLARLQATARWLAPFTVLGVWPGLVPAGGGPAQIHLVLALGGIVRGFEPLVRIPLGADRAMLPWARLRPRVGALMARLPSLPGPVRRWGPVTFVVLCALGYT